MTKVFILRVSRTNMFGPSNSQAIYSKGDNVYVSRILQELDYQELLT